VPAAWRALIADGALATTLVARLPSHRRQILAYVTLRRPLAGERAWCFKGTLDPQCRDAVGHPG